VGVWVKPALVLGLGLILAVNQVPWAVSFTTPFHILSQFR
jgi:hypothetical protein